MRHYLQMDLRRLFKTRSYYIAMVMALLLIGLFALASWLFGDAAVRHGGDAQFAGMTASQLLISARKLFNVSRFSSFFMASPSLMHLLLTLFAAGYISKEHHTGYLKNLFLIPGMREKWLVSKLLTMLVAGILFYLAILVGSAVATLLYGNALVINPAQLLSFFGLHLTADLALWAVLCLVTAIFQSKTAAVVAGMVLTFNMQAIVYLLLDQTGLFPFSLMDYGMMNLTGGLDISSFGGAAPDMISTMMASALGTDASPVTAGRLLPVTLGVFLAATVLTWFTLRRRDYKG